VILFGVRSGYLPQALEFFDLRIQQNQKLLFATKPLAVFIPLNRIDYLSEPAIKKQLRKLVQYCISLVQGSLLVFYRLLTPTMKIRFAALSILSN
jgi:hypothetical protein